MSRKDYEVVAGVLRVVLGSDGWWVGSGVVGWVIGGRWWLVGAGATLGAERAERAALLSRGGYCSRTSSNCRVHGRNTVPQRLAPDAIISSQFFRSHA